MAVKWKHAIKMKFKVKLITYCPDILETSPLFIDLDFTLQNHVYLLLFQCVGSHTMVRGLGNSCTCPTLRLALVRTASSFWGWLRRHMNQLLSLAGKKPGTEQIRESLERREAWHWIMWVYLGPDHEVELHYKKTCSKWRGKGSLKADHRVSGWMHKCWGAENLAQLG